MQHRDRNPPTLTLTAPFNQRIASTRLPVSGIQLYHDN